jgi:hypothetical protein
MSHPVIQQLSHINLAQSPNLAQYHQVAQAVAGYNSLVDQVNTGAVVITDVTNAMYDWLLEVHSHSYDIGQSESANIAWRYELEQLAMGIRTATELLKAGKEPGEIDITQTHYLSQYADILQAVNGYNAALAEVTGGTTILADATNTMYDWLMELHSHIQDALPHAAVNDTLLVEIEHMQAAVQQATSGLHAYGVAARND